MERGRPPRYCCRRVEHEGAVIIGVVVRAQARLSVVLAAGGDRGRVKGIDSGAGGGGEGDMDVMVACGTVALADPEEGLAGSAEADRGAVPVASAETSMTMAMPSGASAFR